jgi:acetyl-CoA C-acetyltransferase
MCANIDVDQGAAILLCSYEAAKAAGVRDDNIVFLHASAEAHDHYFVTERETLATSPAMHAAGTEALRHAQLGIDDVAHFDLYSCFPSAVQIGRAALGISSDDTRPLTVTGGLGFAGGPVNNYPSHGIARMVETLRTQPDTFGLTTALGWYVSKHAVGVWSAQPPRQPFAVSHPQARVDALPRRDPAGLVDTEAKVEATSVAVERDGTPTVGIVTALLTDGRRAIANTRDAGVLRDMMSEPWEGRTVKLANDGTTNSLR